MHGSGGGAHGGGFGGSPAAGVGHQQPGALRIAPPMGVVCNAQLELIACTMYVDAVAHCSFCRLPHCVWQQDGQGVAAGYLVRGRTSSNAASISACCGSIGTDAVLRWLATNRDWSRR